MFKHGSAIGDIKRVGGRYHDIVWSHQSFYEGLTGKEISSALSLPNVMNSSKLQVSSQ